MSEAATLKFQTLQSGDRAVLDHVAPGVFDHALDPRLVAEFLGDERHHVVVAVDRGEVVAFASGVHYVHPDKPAELWINEVGVATSHQGRGIGKAVIISLLRHAERLGCREACGSLTVQIMPRCACTLRPEARNARTIM